MAIAYLGLGSNLGDRERHLTEAIERIEAKGIAVRKRSSLYETEPWGLPGQPLFLNMALEVETELEPHALLAVLKAVEKELGREETYHWGPRVIDLDILLYNNMIVTEDALSIPHPLLQEREFVLRPLQEIAPDVVHPLLKRSIRELFRECIARSKRDHGIP